MKDFPQAGQVHKHHEGRNYKVLCLAKDQDREELLVIHQGDDGQIWSRTIGNFIAYKGGIKRFTLHSPAVVTVDLDGVAWEMIQTAAGESEWMPPEYMQNDWLSDVCSFLREGTKAFVQEGDYYPAVDIDKLVRELDVLLNGSGAAPQAKLCDIVAQLKRDAAWRGTTAVAVILSNYSDDPDARGSVGVGLNNDGKKLPVGTQLYTGDEISRLERLSNNYHSLLTDANLRIAELEAQLAAKK